MRLTFFIILIMDSINSLLSSVTNASQGGSATVKAPEATSGTQVNRIDLDTISQAPANDPQSNKLSAQEIIAAKLIKAIKKEFPSVDTEVLKEKATNPSELMKAEFLASLSKDPLKNNAIAREVVSELSGLAKSTLNSKNEALVNLALDSLQTMALKPVKDADPVSKNLTSNAIREVAQIAYNIGYSAGSGGAAEDSIPHEEFLESRAKNIINAIPETNLHLLVEAMAGYSFHRAGLHSEFSDILAKALKSPESSAQSLFTVVRSLHHTLEKAEGAQRWGATEKLTSDELSGLELVSKAIQMSGTTDKYPLELKATIDKALETNKQEDPQAIKKNVLTELATKVGTTLEGLVSHLTTAISNKKSIETPPSVN